MVTEKTVGQTESKLARRGLVAGAAALAVGLLAKQAAPVEAAHGDAVYLGYSNTDNLGYTTAVNSNAAGYPAIVAFNNSTASYSDGLDAYAYSSNGNGVFGYSYSGNGIFGSSTYGTGVYGYNYTGYSGLYGTGYYTPGVVGFSYYNSGVRGYSSTTSYGAIYGQASGGAYAISGYAASGSVYAGVFTGSVYVSGGLKASGGVSSIAAHPDGTARTLYSVESPDSWFEDFGEAKVAGGKAEVKLDPDFAALVDTKAMHVFITEMGSNNSLHVSAKSATSFSIEADSGALAARGKKATDVNGSFTYRVVAKRKDINLDRLAKITLPKSQPVDTKVVAKAADAPKTDAKPEYKAPPTKNS